MHLNGTLANPKTPFESLFEGAFAAAYITWKKTQQLDPSAIGITLSWKNLDARMRCKPCLEQVATKHIESVAQGWDVRVLSFEKQL